MGSWPLRVVHGDNFRGKLVASSRISKDTIFFDFSNLPVLFSPNYKTIQIDVNSHVEESETLRFMNHSCDPNTNVDTQRGVCIAARDIEEGEEVTFFYPSTEWSMAQVFECACGSPNCIGTVSGASALSPEVLKRYFINPHILRMLDMPQAFPDENRASEIPAPSQPVGRQSSAASVDRMFSLCILQPSPEGDSAFAPYDPMYVAEPYFRGYRWEMHHLAKSDIPGKLDLLIDSSYDLFVNLCDGAADENIPGIDVLLHLEKRGTPFTGARPAFYASSRQEMKNACLRLGLRTPAYRFVSDPEEIAPVVRDLAFPLIVKHHNSYASVGLTRDSRVSDPEQLRRQLRVMIEAFGTALVEEFIEGREFSVLVAENPDDALIPLAYTPVEFHFAAGETFKHFEAKFVEYRQTAVVRCMEATLSLRLKRMAADLFVGMNGSGYGRCDIRMNTEGELFMLEINPNCGVFYPPGTPGCADIILAGEEGGHAGFVDAIVRSGLKRGRQVPAAPHQTYRGRL